MATTFQLPAFLLLLFSPVSAQTTPGIIKPPTVIITDPTWDVSCQKTHFGEYPLSAEQAASPSSPLYGGTCKAAYAEHNERSKIVPGSMPIWRNRTADGEGEAYQFRKNVQLGADPIKKITLSINCDDVARVYINKRLVSADKRDGKLKDGYDDWFTFRSVSGFMYDRIYTYDVTEYFFTQVENTILIEAVSLAFDGSHAYISASIDFEFGPIPVAPRPAPIKAKPAARPKPNPPAAAQSSTGIKPSAPEKTIFEAGRDPEIEKLKVGSILELGQVFFKADEDQLDSSSNRTLSALASFLKRYPSLKIEVGGHTNLRPNEEFAATLSENRAKAVLNFLKDQGVPADRLTYKGYGKSQPRIRALSKDADRANQRVELKVLEK